MATVNHSRTVYQAWLLVSEPTSASCHILIRIVRCFGRNRRLSILLNGRLSAVIGSDFGIEAYRRTLYQPYAVHVQKNSAAVITGLTSQIASTVVVIIVWLLPLQL